MRPALWLEPAKEGGKARWTGTGRSSSRDIAQAIGRAVHGGLEDYTVMSKRANAVIERIREFVPGSQSNGELTLTKDDSSRTRLWTFGVTRANRTVAKQIQFLAEVTRIDGLGMELRLPFDTTAANFALLVADLALSIDEIEGASKPMKFVNCLPTRLIIRIIKARQFDQPNHS